MDRIRHSTGRVVWISVFLFKDHYRKSNKQNASHHSRIAFENEKRKAREALARESAKLRGWSKSNSQLMNDGRSPFAGSFKIDISRLRKETGRKKRQDQKNPLSNQIYSMIWRDPPREFRSLTLQIHVNKLDNCARIQCSKCEVPA